LSIQVVLVFRSQVLAVLFIALATSSTAAPLAWSYRTGNYSWAVAVSRDGRYVVCGSDDMHAYFFGTGSKGVPAWSYLSSGYVRHVAISDDGSRVAIGDSDGNVFLFNPGSNGSPDWSYRSSSSISALAVTGSGAILVAGDREGRLYAFATDSAHRMIWEDAIPGGVLALSLSSALDLAVTGAKGGLYFFTQVPQGAMTWSYENSTTFPEVALDDRSSRVVVGGSNGDVHMISASGQLVARQHIGGAVSALSVAATGELILAGSTNGRVSLYESRSELREIGSLQNAKPITAVALDDDGDIMAYADLDGSVSMYRNSLREQAWTFGTGAIVHSLSMSGNGLVMAASSDNGSVYLFDEEVQKKASGVTLDILFAPVIIAACAFLYLLWRKRTKTHGKTL